MSILWLVSKSDDHDEVKSRLSTELTGERVV